MQETSGPLVLVVRLYSGAPTVGVDIAAGRVTVKVAVAVYVTVTVGVDSLGVGVPRRAPRSGVCVRLGACAVCQRTFHAGPGVGVFLAVASLAVVCSCFVSLDAV